MSIITGAIILPTKAAFVGSILFEHEWAPMADDPAIITDADFTVTTDALGDFSQTIATGRYKVRIGASRPIHIEVPDDDLEYNLLDLVVDELASAPIVPWEPGSGLPTATTTTPGAVKISSPDADPVCLLVQDGVLAEPAGGSYRVKAGNFQLYNQTTAKWHTIYLYGNDGSVELSFGPGET